MRYELRFAPVDGVRLLLWRDRLSLGPDFPCPQPLIANKRDVTALWAERGVQFIAGTVGQPGNLAVEPGEVQIAIERDQNGLAVGRPFVSHNALQIANPLALALHLFGLGQFLARSELEAVDQHRPLARLAVEPPQVIPLPVVRTVPQHGQPAPIWRQLDPARHRTVQAGAGKDAFEIERLGLGWL